MELITKQIHADILGKGITDQFFIDDDFNVPDAKYDVSRIIMGKGWIRAEEIRKTDHYIHIAGQLFFKVLYVTEEGVTGLSSLEGSRPFEENVYVEAEEEEQYFIKNPRVEFTASLIHSRKLNIKAMVEFEIGTEKMEDTSLTLDVETEESLLKKKKEIRVLQMQTSKKDTYRIKEEMTLPGTKENIGTLLWTDVSERKIDTRLSQDELNISGELEVFCFYESQDGKTDWVEQTIPYEGRIECFGADETMYHHVYTVLNDPVLEVKMDEDGEMRAFGIEATLELHIMIYEEESVEVLEDLYSLDKICSLKTERKMCEELLLQNHSKYKISEQLTLPEIKNDILQICHNDGNLQVDHIENVEKGIQIDGILHLQFLYVKENDEVPFDTWKGMIPFSFLLECKGMGEGVRTDLHYALEQLSVSLMGSGEIEVKAVLAFYSFIRKAMFQDTITDIVFEEQKIEEMGKQPGIIGYLVKEGDELWDLAKRYSTTVERIKNINEMGEEDIKEGDKILIFKENMSIL